MTGSFSSPKQRAKLAQNSGKTAHLPECQNQSLREAEFSDRYIRLLRSVAVRKSKVVEVGIENRVPRLPIERYLPKIVKHLERFGIVVVHASMGSGKTTRITPAVMKRGHKIWATQPRRFPAAATHEHLQSLVGGKDGEIIGLRHALGGTSHRDPQGMVVTDGILTKKLFTLFREYSKLRLKEPVTIDLVCMQDEAHEHNLNMEVNIALVRHMRSKGIQVPFILSSGTIDTNEIIRFFGKKTPVVRVPTTFKRVYEIKKGESLLADIASQVALGRDTLVFLPGKRQIRQLQAQLLSSGIDAEVLPLHSQLSSSEQDRVHQKYGRPKVVLATNIAQTSVTIEGLKTVIITGYQKRMTVEGGMEVLTVMPISQSDFEQQKWRVGRIEDGYLINRGPPFETLTKYPAYPIQNSLLDDFCLQFLLNDIDPESLKFLHPPPQAAFDLAFQQLRRLGFIGNKKHCLPAARAVAELPLQLRSRKFVSEALQSSRGNAIVETAAITIASILESDGIAIGSERSKWGRLLAPIKDLASKSDLFTEWYLYSRIENTPEQHRKKFCQRHGLSYEKYNGACEIRAEIARRTGVETSPVDFANVSNIEIETLLKAIWQGWSDYVFRRTSGRSQRDSMYKPVFDKKGKAAMLSRSSTVEAAPLVIGRPFGLMEDVDAAYEGNIKRLLCHVTAVPTSWLEENRQSFDAVLSRDAVKKIKFRERSEESRRKRRNGQS